jgi:hypothetical protein
MSSACTHTPTTTRPTGPPAPYPRPAPPPEVRRSSRIRRTPVHDDDARYSVNAYEKTTPSRQETPVQPASDAVGKIKDTETHKEVYKATVHQEKPYNSLCYKEMPESLKHIYILTEVQIVIRELFVTQICY